MLDLSMMDYNELCDAMDKLEEAKAGLEALNELGLDSDVTVDDLEALMIEAEARVVEIDRMNDEYMRRAYEKAVL